MLLPGIRIRDLEKHVDDRGYLAEVMRQDWVDLFGDEDMVQANLSMSYPGVIRAWHRHAREQIDYYIALEGTMRICAYDDEEGSETRGELTEVALSGERLQVLRVPGHYWHGHITLSDGPSLMLYFKNRLYDYDDPDEQRRPWNDPSVVDPRTGEGYDWLRPIHK
jgi:dTDP-4-dehydrorhamnose 3,5-epimerase